MLAGVTESLEVPFLERDNSLFLSDPGIMEHESFDRAEFDTWLRHVGVSALVLSKLYCRNIHLYFALERRKRCEVCHGQACVSEKST